MRIHNSIGKINGYPGIMAGRLSKLDQLGKWLNKFRPWIYKDKVTCRSVSFHRRTGLINFFLEPPFKGANESFMLKKSELNFTLMSYNILSEDNMLRHPDLYSFCPPDALKWPNRGGRILKEIELNNPDILCRCSFGQRAPKI